jgi:osmotically-inducible protein OsmY
MSRQLNFLLLATALFALQGCASSLTRGADRRTQGAYIEDGTITDTATTRIRNKYADKVHINVNSYNRKVLLTGEVADEAVKADISRIAGGVQNVTEINNELIVAPLATLSSRSADALTTSNVMLRMRDNGKDFRAERIEVVTENGTVYLLGLVTRSEADIAKEVARTSSGVKKVVPLLEFID